MRRQHPSRQKGVAIVTALLIVSLAMTLIAGLFWRQQLAFETIKVAEVSTENYWLRELLTNWVKVVLQSHKANESTTTLGQTWATKVQKTSLKDFMEQDKASVEKKLDFGGEGLLLKNVSIEGYNEDAQGLYNLRNLVKQNDEGFWVIDPIEYGFLERLVYAMRWPPQTTSLLTEAVLTKFTSYNSAAEPEEGTQPSNTAIPQPNTFLPKSANLPQRIEEFLPIPGIEARLWKEIRELIFYVPTFTPLNVNTAKPPLLLARIPELGEAVLKLRVERRTSIPANDLAQFFSMINLPHLLKQYENLLAFDSNYYFINIKTTVGDVSSIFQVLVEVSKQQKGRIWWRRDITGAW